jgi:hypothetical protein
MIVKYPKYAQIQLKIENCTQYAFGQDPSGKSVIWAAGKAGWFEIIPSTRYASVYEDIVKAIDLIYFLSDAHHLFIRRRPIRGAKIEELLVLYQQHTDYRVDDNAEAEAVFGKHHSFLIKQMLDGWEGINWARTHLWSYFSRLYPDEVAHDSETESDEEEEEHEENGEDQNDDQSNSEEDVTKSDCSSGNDRDHEKTWADAIFEEIMSLKAAGHMCKRYCSIEEIAKILVNNYNVASKDEAGGIIKAAAESLLLRLSADPDQGRNRSWNRKGLYRQLESLLYTEQELQEDDATNDVVTPTKAPFTRRHQKSILRPSTGASKGKKRMSKGQSPPEEDIEEECDYEDTTLSPLGAGTLTKKRRLDSNSMKLLEPKMTNGSTMPVVATNLDGSTSDLQLEQLDLIRKESLANGRLHVNFLEALVEGLAPGRITT